MATSYTMLIQPDALAASLAQAPALTVVCDCRFNLADPDEGARDFNAGHIPGAVYLHLDAALSGPKTGMNGRHPLPARGALAAAMAAAGAGADSQIVAYDAADGMFAARLWWLMRWLGHRRVAVLDGGFAAWVTLGGIVETGPPRPRPPGGFTARDSLVPVTDYPSLRVQVGKLILDARAPDRFRGENETLDKTGGHIPGAKNHFFRENLGPNGRFKPPAALRLTFQALLGGRPAADVVSQCGSGVTACHNLLAMELAGLTGAVLYPGSWSEWCAQPDAPMATGTD